MGSNPQPVHQSMKLFFIYFIYSSYTDLSMVSLHLQELEKTKPVVLTGDLNCAHEEIDIYNPAVTNSQILHFMLLTS